MSLWFSHPLFLPSLVVIVTIPALGNLAITGIYHRAAVLHGGDGGKNRPTGRHLWRLCLLGVLAGIQRLCAGRGDPQNWTGGQGGKSVVITADGILAADGLKRGAAELCAGVCNAL